MMPSMMMEGVMKFCFLGSNSPKAQEAVKEFSFIYDNHSIEDCDVIIAFGGDGFLLEVFHMMFDKGYHKPVYGMNRGTVGFMLNEFKESNLITMIENSKVIHIHPLRMIATCVDGHIESKYAFNDINIYRQSGQAIKFEVKVNGKIRIPELVGDGILLSTPSGSTSYNASAGGPIVPLGSNVMPLTPICPFRPRPWKGALLTWNDNVEFNVHEYEKRPVSASADSFSIQNILNIKGYMDKTKTVSLLFNNEDCLEERVFSEQFPK